MNSNPLISIIMPAYNAEPWIEEAIKSVIDQTYQNWELLITEDCSIDNTRKLLANIIKQDNRIKINYNQINKGVAESRNKSLSQAKGRFVAYLDADDVWFPTKLENQLSFMQQNSVAMCFTSYETIEADGTYRNTVHIPLYVSYKDFLKKPVTCSHTIMFDTEKVKKELLVMPELKRGQDGATWCRVLKNGFIGRGLDLVLAYRRIHPNSLSSNKLSAIKRTWYIYRKVEQLNIADSAYYFVFYAFNAIAKRRRN